MEDLVKFGVVIIFIGILVGGAMGSCASISGANAESSYDSAYKWATENKIKVTNINCNNKGNCTVNSDGRFIGLTCPVMFETGSCTVKVRSVDLQE